MTPGAPAVRCNCPICIARDALELLDGGRPDMARLVMRDLPAAIEAAVVAAYEEGRRAAAAERPAPKRAAKRAARPVPAYSAVAAELREHCSAVGPERVAAALGIGVDDLDGLLAGTVEPPRAGMQRLRRGRG